MQGYNIILENLRGLSKTGGMMLYENSRYRAFSEIEYHIFKKYNNLGLKPNKLINESTKSYFKYHEYQLYLKEVSKYDGQLITERRNSSIKKSKIINEFKVHSNLAFLREEDVMDKKIKNPETGRDIKVSTAYSNPDHPVHDKAKKLVQKSGGGHEEDEHGDDHGGHGDDHGHHDDGLSAKEKAALGAVDVVMKKIPGVSLIAGQSEAIYKNMKKVTSSAKEAEGVVNKAKAMGGAAKKMFSGWADKAKQDFANSMHDENTGERKKLGAVLGSKAKALGKSIVKGLKEEVKHVAHELGEGVSAIKDVVKDPSVIKDPKWQKKLATGIKGAATVAVIGMAAASGPAGMALKAASLAINPGDTVRSLLTAHLYRDLGSKKILESTNNKLLRLIESKVDKLDESFMIELMGVTGEHELKKVESPLDDYKENEMDEVVKNTQLVDEISEAKNKDNKE